MRIIQFAAALAAATLGAQPALAADDFRNIDARPEHRRAAFAGAHVSIPLGGGGPARRAPSARLQLAVDHVYEDRRAAGPAAAYRTAALELGVSRSASSRARPALFVAGAPVRGMERRLGVSTGGAIAIGVGVTLVALLAVAAAAGPPDEITP